MDSQNTNDFQEHMYSNISLLKIQNFQNQNNILPQLSPIQESYKTLYDPIHKYITFPEKMWEIIDTPEFQRLRRLKQLSTTSFIYLGANHTRFEHCIGTGFLSRDLVKKGFKSLNTENNYFIECVSYAGLCHDIAHGPFSHTFNRILNSLNIGANWEHEKFSEDILNYLIDKNYIEGIDSDMLKLITSLIIGDKKVKTEHDWIYQIVANKTNSIDVDKFDYICRDVYHLGIQTLSVDYARVFMDINVIDEKICFNEKNDLTLASIFESRYNLHKKVYQHNKNICIEAMVRDALKLSNEYFHFENCINSAEKFLELDDSIIEIVKNFSNNPNVDIQENHNLQKAEKIINDLYNRNTYRFVGEILIPNNQYYVPDIQEFLSYDNPKDEFYLTEEDIEISKTSIDYGYGKKNPFNTIYFYNPKVPGKWFKKLQNHSIMTPDIFKEYYIKIICKDQNKMERANKLFELLKERLKRQWSLSSPVKVKESKFNYESNNYTASKNNLLNHKRDRIVNNVNNN